MAIQRMEGFESGLIPSGFTASGGTATADTTVKRSGGYSWKVTNPSGSATLTLPATTVAAAGDGFGIALGWQSTVLAGQTLVGILCTGGTANALTLGVNSGGALFVMRGTSISSAVGTALTTSASVVGGDTWHHIELWTVFHDTTGVVKVWADGVLVIDFLGDTINSGTPGTGRSIESYRSSGNTTVYLDDIVYYDSTGSFNNVAPLGPCKIEALRPTSDDLAGFTRSTGAVNYALVDEAPVSATDYVSATVAATKDRYGLADRVLTGAVKAVAASAVGVNTDGGSASIKVGLKSGATETISAAKVLSATTTHVQEVFNADPASGIAFTTSDVNALLLAVEAA